MVAHVFKLLEPTLGQDKAEEQARLEHIQLEPLAAPRGYSGRPGRRKAGMERALQRVPPRPPTDGEQRLCREQSGAYPSLGSLARTGRMRIPAPPPPPTPCLLLWALRAASPPGTLPRSWKQGTHCSARTQMETLAWLPAHLLPLARKKVSLGSTHIIYGQRMGTMGSAGAEGKHLFLTPGTCWQLCQPGDLGLVI